MTFPEDEDDEDSEETGLVVLVQPANTTAINNKPIKFRDGILELLFLTNFIHCAKKNSQKYVDLLALDLTYEKNA